MNRLLLTLLFLLLAAPCTLADTSGNRLMSNLLQMGSEALAKRAAKERAAEQENALLPPPHDSLAGVVKEAADALLENYKQDGREYAEELSLILADKVLETPKVKSTLDSVRVLCWGVVVYLTLVTGLIIVLLLRLKALYTRLTKQLREAQKCTP